MKLFGFFTKKRSKSDKKEIVEQLEDLLISSDFGLDLTEKLINQINQSKSNNQDEIHLFLKNQLTKTLQQTDSFNIQPPTSINPLNTSDSKNTQVIMNVGTNGVGKTTSCAKVAYFYQNQGYKVALVAADTFRSGAVNQLKIWAEKYNIYFFESKHKEPNAIAYSAIDSLINNFDLIIIDSAGRSPNETNLMSQIAKLQRIVKNSNILHKTLLTLDGTNGMQAQEQTRIFSEYLSLDALVITKLDGSAKAGVLFDITDTFNYPVAFIGLGEKITDFEVFSAEKFINKIFDTNQS